MVRVEKDCSPPPSMGRPRLRRWLSFAARGSSAAPIGHSQARGVMPDALAGRLPTVLYVEGDAAARAVLSSTLRAAAFAVWEAATAVEARHLATSGPDAVV